MNSTTKKYLLSKTTTTYSSHYAGQPALAGNFNSELEDFVGAKFY